MEVVRQPIGADEVRHAADGVGVPGAPQPAVEGAVHEPGWAGGLGAQDAGLGGRSVGLEPMGSRRSGCGPSWVG